MSALDHAALLQCLQIAERDMEFHEQFKDEPDWRERAESACHRLQSRALHLRPWQDAPCQVDLDDPNDDPDAVALLRRMLNAGTSKFEADPLAALKQRRQNRKK